MIRVTAGLVLLSMLAACSTPQEAPVHSGSDCDGCGSLAAGSYRPPPEPRTPTGYIVTPIGPTFTGKAAVFQDMLYPRGQSYRVTPTYK